MSIILNLIDKKFDFNRIKLDIKIKAKNMTKINIRHYIQLSKVLKVFILLKIKSSKDSKFSTFVMILENIQIYTHNNTDAII